PPESWAYNGDVPHYEHNPERARELLRQAGYPEVNGVRFHLTMKTSTEESTRLMAAVFQQQLREVGIVLDIRTYEFATFFSDVTHGEFQLYSRSEEHTSELQSLRHLVCRLLLEKKK